MALGSLNRLFNPPPSSGEDIVERLKVGIFKHIRDGRA